jgi:Alpha-L-arabinofuranosidase
VEKKNGLVNKLVFGNNFIGFDPTTSEKRTDAYYGYSDYGAGIWDPEHKKSIREATDLAKEAGVTILRFPGGCGSHHYNWKNTIDKNREHFLYGIDEFLKTCEEIGAEAVITISYFAGNEQDAADLVEYLNWPNDGSNYNGGIDWAARRANNGHSDPYSVKYFEIGNEVYHGNHRDVQKVTPEEYAIRYVKYYDAMKAVDCSIKIGVVFYIYDLNHWNSAVMAIVKEKLDFAIIHTYPSPSTRKYNWKEMDVNAIFGIALGLPVTEVENKIESTLKIIKKEFGRNLSLAVTEYNGGFKEKGLFAYRHSLGTALLNAELLKIFMEPSNNILMANYWQFYNSSWNMVVNGFNGNYEDINKPYYKRPSFFIFELYRKHFGDELIEVKVNSGSYSVDGVNIPYLSVNASRSAGGSKIYLMVVNKNLENSITSTIYLKDFKPLKSGNAWVLNGPSVDATNEEDHDNVKVAKQEFDTEGKSFQFTFEPHSLTAIEIERAK